MKLGYSTLPFFLPPMAGLELTECEKHKATATHLPISVGTEVHLIYLLAIRNELCH